MEKHKKIGIPKVSKKWFDDLVKNSMLMPIVLKRITKLERKVRNLDPKLRHKLHILVWRNVGGIGDILMQSVIARELKTIYPDSYIVYQVPKKYLVIPKHNSYVDEVQIVENPFTEGAFDKIIKLSNPCPASIYEQTRDVVKDRIDLFLNRANIKTKNKKLIYEIKDYERKWAEEFLKRNKVLDKIKIGFELRSVEKRRDWLEWKKLADLIYKNIKNSKIFIFDHDTHMAWKDKKVINVCGFPIEDVAAIVEKLDLIIGPDSGLLHLAGAVGTKILGLFGPINPMLRLNTYKGADWICLTKKCCKDFCWYSYPCGVDSKCMKAIKPSMILEKAKRML